MKALLLIAALVVGLASSFSINVREQIKEEFLKNVTVDGIMRHLRAFQDIADMPHNHGSRSVVNGYNDSGAYVIKMLQAHTDYVITKQHFVVPIYEEIERPQLSFPKSNPPIVLSSCFQRTGWQHYEANCDYSGVRLGGNGTYTISSTTQYVQDACTRKGFAGFTAGRVALIEVSTACDYYTQALNAQESGASAVLLYSRATANALPGSRVRPADLDVYAPYVQIPVVGLSHAAGLALRQTSGVEVLLKTNSVIRLVTTFNVLAETRNGDEDNVVMIGAHLDGVPEGPGINDNGSGSASVLEIALQMVPYTPLLRQRVRFAWWGAEEIGLLGSYHYVDDIVANHPEDAPVAYLNFDMEGGPNYVRMVYNGGEAPGKAHEGSLYLQGMFENHFTQRDLTFDLTGMNGGSDFYPFILAGIPSNGLATGASGLKSIAERAKHGGLANAPLDPCYHAPCDGYDNINRNSISECSAAAADVLFTLAYADRLPFARSSVSKASFKSAVAQGNGNQFSCDAVDEIM
eukprot:Colp12_sorted_trinity150504_noHs@564